MKLILSVFMYRTSNWSEDLPISSMAATICRLYDLGSVAEYRIDPGSYSFVFSCCTFCQHTRVDVVDLFICRRESWIYLYTAVSSVWSSLTHAVSVSVSHLAILLGT